MPADVAYSLFKVGRSANKFRKLQIRKFANLNNLLDLRTFRIFDTSQICNLRTQSIFWFADFRK